MTSLCRMRANIPLLATAFAMTLFLTACGSSTTGSGSGSGNGGGGGTSIPYTATNFYVEDSYYYPGTFSPAGYDDQIQIFSMQQATTQSVIQEVSSNGDYYASGFGAISIDPSGVLYVGNNVYNSGSISPVIRRVTTPTAATAQQGEYSVPGTTNAVAADKNGYVYAAVGTTLFQYHYSTSTAANWSRSICTNGFTITAVAVDSSANVYVACGPNISVYSAGMTATSAASKTLTVSGGAADMALDSSQNLFVRSSNSVLVFSSSQSGAATPVRTITIPTSTMPYVGGLAVDSGGMAYVSGHDNNNYVMVLCYAPGSSGSGTPYLTFNTNQLLSPRGGNKIAVY